MFTFTTMGNFGRIGPKSTQTYANYPFSNFSIINGQQQWVVPQTGAYTITAAGARGALPGRVVQGTVSLIAGQTVSILVGQLPYPLIQQNNLTLGGGGGTFVVLGNTPLVIASGGDGSTSGLPGQFSGSGGKSGGGYTSNGIAADPFVSYNYPYSYVTGGYGGQYTYTTSRSEGGFGGGQAPYNVPLTIVSCIGNGTVATVSTTIPHLYTNIYYVKINAPPFSGNYLINSKGSNTFTFNTSIVGSVTSGTVSGIFSGVPGGGGYMGGSGATCYGNVTDLGPTSNTAGYVTVSLVGAQPSPIQPWNPSWYSVGQYLPVCVARTWSPLLNSYVAISCGSIPILSIGDSSFPLTNLQPRKYLSIACSPSGNLVTSNGYTSFDGINWTQGNVNTPVGDYVNYLNGQFVATFSLVVNGDADLHTICVSPDGYNWSFLTSDTSMKSITAYGNGKYIGIPTDPNYTVASLAYSSDLMSWTIADTSTYWQSIDFGNGIFVACGYDYNYSNGEIKYSYDGVTWYTASVDSSYQWSSVRFTAAFGFIVFSYPFNTPWGAYATSLDGIHWSLNIQNNNLIGGLNFSGLGYIGAYWISSNSENVTFQVGGSVYTVKGSIIWTEFSQVQYFPNSIAWSASLGAYVTANSQYLRNPPISVGYKNQEIFLLETAASYPLYITWSSELGIFVLYNPTKLLYTSSDGQTWTRQTAPKFIPNCNPLWVKELGIFVTGNATSPDGVNWSLTGGPAPYSIASNAGLLIGVDGTNAYSSLDGIHWSSKTLSAWGVAYGNGRFVSVGQSGPTMYIYTSDTNGATWTQTYSTSVQVYNFNISARPPLIVWAPEIAQYIVAFSVGYLDMTSDQIYRTFFFSSFDGTIWVQQPDMVNLLGIDKVFGIEWTGQRLLAVSAISSGVFFSN
jgi:hypothetical protein